MTMPFKKFAIAMIVGAALAVAAPASAATIVKVGLWDQGAETPMSTTLSYPAAGLDKSKATMGITATPATVPAGEVSFEVTNTSKDTVHEMIVIYLADPAKALPYIEDDSRVDEDKAGDKGEVSELDPGKSGTLTLTLQPGKYLLICNVPGHFAAGMWSEFEVTK
jgi:uncharacterized cupredoxin-like copper-binding protein